MASATIAPKLCTEAARDGQGKDRFRLPVFLRKTSGLLRMNLNVRRGAAYDLSAPHPAPALYGTPVEYSPASGYISMNSMFLYRCRSSTFRTLSVVES